MIDKQIELIKNRSCDFENYKNIKPMIK